MVTVPDATPDTAPLDAPTVATDVLELLHDPPAVPLVSVVVEPTHTTAVPAFEPGRGFTVAVMVRIQPVDNV